MKVTSSYAVEVKNVDKYFKVITKIWKKAISYCIPLVEYHWDSELDCMNSNEQVQLMDRLLHTTSSHEAIYDFDEKFPKMPSYFRKAVIKTVLGHISSYHSNYDNWVSKGGVGNPPCLSTKLNKLPIFYNKNMYVDDDKLPPYTVKLKLFYDNDWKWLNIRLKKTDVKYLVKHCNMGSISSPTLERRNKKWFLRFTFEDDVELNDTKLDDMKILAVDLGMNTDAVCSVMKVDGTILARKFINFASDKDYLKHTLNKIKKVSQTSGVHNTSKLWRIARFYNEEHSRKVSKVIVDYAIEQGVNVIVFEYLDFKKGLRGKNGERFHFWRKRSIQRMVELKAHKKGIRFSRVNACNTSRLAYDGTGVVERGIDDNYSICKFQSGKIYNCDLNASYNIGARYYIRELKKSTSVRVWSYIETEVSECKKRSRCTMGTLLRIQSCKVN